MSKNGNGKAPSNGNGNGNGAHAPDLKAEIMGALDESGVTLPHHAAIIAALATNGGVIRKAAEVLGLPESTVKRALDKHPEYREAITRVHRLVAATAGVKAAERWSEFHIEAQDRLLELSRQKDDLKVAYWATRDIVERLEGKAKATVAVAVEEDQSAVSAPVMRMAVSLLLTGRFPSLVEAIEHLERNPDAVESWAGASAGAMN